MEVYDRLAEVRTYFEESQTVFAKKLDIGQSVYARYEKGDRGIPDSVKTKLYQIGINLNWLLTGEGEMLSVPPTIGERIKDSRHKLNQEQDVMATFSGVSMIEYQALEDDRAEPSEEVLRKMRGNFNINPSWIMSGDGPQFLPPLPNDKKLNVNEDDEEDFKEAVPDVYKLFTENRRLKEQKGEGCSVCDIVNQLDQEGAIKVKGYAEALLHEQTYTAEDEANHRAG